MSGLVLDAGALIAVERRDRRVLRLLELARERGLTIQFPAGVVAQAWRGGGRQAVLARFLAADGLDVDALDLVTGRAVGELCALAGGDDVVDAHVALLALRRRCTVLTSDPDDIERLTRGHVNVVAI